MREGWERVPLESLISHIIGGAWGKAPGEADVEVTAFGTKAFVGGASILSADTGTPRSVSRGQYAKRELSDGDIILEVSGGSNTQAVGRVLYVDGDMPFVIPSSFMRLLRFDQTRVLPRFAFLLLQWLYQSGRSAACQSNTTGIRNLNVPVYLGTSVALPPIAEQRRIVDLIGALDEVIMRAGECVDSTGVILEQLRAIEATNDSEMLGTLVTMRSGPSWKSQDESDRPGTGLVPVLGITNTPFGSGIRLEPRKFVSGLPQHTQRLTPRSLVMIRTNGNRSRIGNVYRATPDVEGHAVSAFQIAIEPLDCVDPAFLYWYLGSRRVQNLISDKASGTTGLGNISIGELKKLPIPTLSAEAYKQYVSCCDAASALMQEAQESLRRLRDLRTNMLTALLSGKHEIPESYSDVREVAA